MKKNIKLAGLMVCTLLMVFIVALSSSCKQDSCKTVNCAYGGSCVNGLCTCQPGYEGPNCETMSRDKFTGSWEVTQVGPLASMNKYAMRILKDSLATLIQLDNLTNGISATAIYASVLNDSLTIAKQIIGQDTVYGSGAIYQTAGTATGYNYISLVYYIAYPQGKVDEYILHSSR